MLTGGPAPSMCTSSSGPMAATEGAPGCRVRVSVAILESATTPAAAAGKTAGSGGPPPRSGPKAAVGGGSRGMKSVRAATLSSTLAWASGRMPEAWEGWGMNIPGREGTAGNPVPCSRTAHTLSWGWRAGGGGRIADTRAGIRGVPGGVRISSGTEAGSTRRLFSGRRRACSNSPGRSPSGGDPLSRELQSHRA